MKFIAALFILVLVSCSHSPQRRMASTPVYETGFLSALGSFPSLHSATLAESPSQRKLIGCWYAGSREMGPDVQIYCSTSNSDFIKWSAARVAVAAQEVHTDDILKSKSMGNPVLFHDDEAKVTYLFFGTVTLGGWRGVRTFYRVSKDFGQSWSGSIPVNGDFAGDSMMLGRMGKFVRIKPLQISEKEFLLPMYSEWDDKRSFSCVFKKQEDLFKEEKCQVMPGAQSLQPSFVFFDDKVLAYTRSKNKFVQTSQLNLKTREWAPLENLVTPNPDSSVDSVVTFDQRSILMVGNAITQGRYSMDLLISENGKDFKKIFSFDRSDNLQAEFSYPSLIKTSDGFYHLAYTYQRKGIKYIRFNDDWLQEQLKSL